MKIDVFARAALLATSAVLLLAGCGADDGPNTSNDTGGTDAVDGDVSPDADGNDAADTGDVSVDVSVDVADTTETDATDAADASPDVDTGTDDVDAGTDVGADADDASTDTSDVADAADTGDADASEPIAVLGAACVTDDECGTSGLCLSGFCVVRCQGVDASADACERVAVEPALIADDWSCPPDYPYCAPVADGQAAQCTSDAQCALRGDGLVCATLTYTNGAVERLCVPDSGLAGDGAACDVDSDCAGRWCHDGSCAAPCAERADCAADAICTTLPTELGEELFCVSFDPTLVCVLGDDTCVEGTCTRDETLAPGLGRCFEPVGECENDGDCNDGVACTTNICIDGTCEYAPDDAACSDAFACTTNTCDVILGCRVETNDAACSDDIACTDDVCTAALGCVSTPINSRCNDGVACTDDICDDELGCTAVPVNARCTDGVACSVDVCDVITGCENTPDNTLCEDSDACTNNVCGVAGCEFPDNGTCPDGPVFADVRSILQAKCSSCHTVNSFAGFNANSYSTYLAGASHFSCVGQNKGTCAQTRIRAGTMPPSGCTGNPATDAGRPGCLTAAEQGLLADWIDAGMPE